MRSCDHAQGMTARNPWLLCTRVPSTLIGGSCLAAIFACSGAGGSEDSPEVPRYEGPTAASPSQPNGAASNDGMPNQPGVGGQANAAGGSNAENPNPSSSFQPGGIGGAGGTSSSNGGVGNGDTNTGGTQGDTTDPDDMDPNVPPLGGVGRVGSELCPSGPFGDPLPANPQIEGGLPVGENNFFIFEGPVWTGDALLFSEIGSGSNPPPSRINRFVPGGTIERGVIENTGSNGLALDAAGNLIAATHDVGAISAFAAGSAARSAVGAQTFNGQRFNSPNDVVVRNDGNVYFTDPTSQAPGNPQGATRVYRLSPAGEASIVDDTIGGPNGVTLSPDGNTLYVTGAGRFVRYALDEDGTPSAGTDIQLQEPLETPDGMAVDCAGNVYTTEHNLRRIRVFDPEGNELGRLDGTSSFERGITNLAFGGPDRRTLFVTTLTQDQDGGLYWIELNIPGLPY